MWAVGNWGNKTLVAPHIIPLSELDKYDINIYSGYVGYNDQGNQPVSLSQTYIIGNIIMIQGDPSLSTTYPNLRKVIYTVTKKENTI